MIVEIAIKLGDNLLLIITAIPLITTIFLSTILASTIMSDIAVETTAEEYTAYDELINGAVESVSRELTPSGMDLVRILAGQVFPALAESATADIFNYIREQLPELSESLLELLAASEMTEESPAADVAALTLHGIVASICGAIPVAQCSYWEVADELAKVSAYAVLVEDRNRRPMKVMTEVETFVHEMSHETAYGLQVAHDLVTASDAKPSYDLSFDGVTSEPITRPYFDTKPRYSCVIGEMTYEFADFDFLQGFRTGCDWCDIEYTSYISELQDNEKPISLE